MIKKFFKNRTLLIILLSQISSVVISVAVLFCRSHMTVSGFVHKLSHPPFLGDHNGFQPFIFAGFYLNSVMYAYVLLSVVIAFVLSYLFRIERTMIFTRKTVLTSLTVSFMMMVSCQVTSFNRFFQALMADTWGKSLEERMLDRYQDVYAFPLECRKILPGKHTAGFITDMDLQHDPGMYYFRALAVFFYPIDIRHIRREDQDCLIVFRKTDAENYVPPGYKILLKYGDESLLAIKKETP